jgi:GGDEF domain-containing protein
VIAFLAILFALQNTNLVTIQFFIWEYRQSLALILLGTLAIGVIVGLLISFPAILRRNLKASRVRRQADSLTELVQEKEQAISTQSQQVGALKRDYEELLASLGVIESTTGLLKNELLQQVVAAQIQHTRSTEDTAQLPPINVLMLKAQPTLADGYPVQNVFAGVAQRLQQQASTNTWLYSNGRGLFSATTTGLDTQALTRYAESLQAAIVEDPLTLPTGSPVEISISVGCAIADKPPANAENLVATATAALEQAIQRGKNRVRILHTS